jgi:hypothetical protein
VGKGTHLGGLVTFHCATDATKTMTLTIDSTGNATSDCSGNKYYFANTDQVNILSTTQATSPSTGCAVFSGGVGIAKSLYVGGTIQSTSTATGCAIFSGGVGIAGNEYLGGALYLPTSGGTAAGLDYYEELAYTPNCAGPMTTTFTSAFIRAGKQVTLSWAQCSGTSSTSCNISMSSNIPSRMAPASTIYKTILVSDSGTMYVGQLAITTTQLNIWKVYGSTTITDNMFSGSGTVIIYASSVSYNVA